jgi:hypothetical protein
LSGSGRAARRWVFTVGLLALPSSAVGAEKQIRPFVAVTFGGGTTFVDLEGAVGKPNVAIGVNAVLLGEIVGVEVDAATAPGFFQSGDLHLVLGSRVTTVTGNVVVAAPHRLTEYRLRPYFVGGVGVMTVRITDYFDVLTVAQTMPTLDLGGGAIGFITNRIGICWDVRRFTSLGGSDQERGVSLGGEHLSYWRASMALVIRY